MPDFPTEWSATVEANIVDQGYTYVQKETYSQTQVGARGFNGLASLLPQGFLVCLQRSCRPACGCSSSSSSSSSSSAAAAAAGMLNSDRAARDDAPSHVACRMLWCHH